MIRRTAVVLAIGAFLLWFYLENLRGDQESLSTTFLGLGVMLSGVIVALIAAKRKWDGLGWIAGIYLVLAIAMLLSWLYWEDLRDTTESLSATIRNLGLVIGGVIAIVLAVWRSTVAERQAATAQQDLLNERYQKGADMLGNNVLPVRLGGVYALERLAAEHPEQYHVQIMKLLCAFARHPTRDEDYEKKLGERNENPRMLSLPREDVQAAIDAIGSRDKKRVEIETSQDFELNLIGADLSFARIGHANLSGAMLHYANLSNTEISTVDLSQAHLQGAVMNNAHLMFIDFTDARAWDADLSGARMLRLTMPSLTLDNANLSGAQLQRVDLSGGFIQYANLSDVDIRDSDLSDTNFLGSDLSRARIFKSKLSGAEILRTDMSGATLRDTDLSGTYFSNTRGGTVTDLVTGLTQAQLDEACADPDNPPKLDGVLDAETGKPLVWRGRPCEERSC